MALIRGYGGLCPCPICRVPSARQHEVLATFQLRTQTEVQALVHEAQKQDLATSEKMMKKEGLRLLEVSCCL